MDQKAKPAVIRLERTIHAPRHSVYRTWIEPDLVRRWMTPGLEVSRVEIDERVGGHYRVWQAKAGKDVGGFDSEIVGLVPDERIAFRWGFVERRDNEQSTYDSTLTITLHDAPEGDTVLTLIHEQLGELIAAMPHAVDEVRKGWELVLGNLAAVIEEETGVDRDHRPGQGLRGKTRGRQSTHS